MQLTLFTDYALRMLMYLGLSDEGRPVPIQEVSDGCDVSHHYMLKVANELTHLGLIRSTRGRGGGVQLAVDPADVVLGELVRQTEPDRGVLDCVDNDQASCPLISSCLLRGVLSEAEDQFYHVLDRYTLKDIIKRRDRLSPLLGLSP
ncbi:MAG: Rrf2 family transcriptional regulator [Myxococcota bacterium]